MECLNDGSGFIVTAVDSNGVERSAICSEDGELITFDCIDGSLTCPSKDKICPNLCPNACSFHGSCVRTTCLCFSGWSGEVIYFMFKFDFHK